MDPKWIQNGAQIHQKSIKKSIRFFYVFLSYFLSFFYGPDPSKVSSRLHESSFFHFFAFRFFMFFHPKMDPKMDPKCIQKPIKLYKKIHSIFEWIFYCLFRALFRNGSEMGLCRWNRGGMCGGQFQVKKVKKKGFAFLC